MSELWPEPEGGWQEIEAIERGAVRRVVALLCGRTEQKGPA